MNLRVAKKILTNQENLKYNKGQIKSAQLVVDRATRVANKIKKEETTV